MICQRAFVLHSPCTSGKICNISIPMSMPIPIGIYLLLKYRNQLTPNLLPTLGPTSASLSPSSSWDCSHPHASSGAARHILPFTSQSPKLLRSSPACSEGTKYQRICKSKIKEILEPDLRMVIGSPYLASDRHWSLEKSKPSRSGTMHTRACLPVLKYLGSIGRYLTVGKLIE